MTKRGRRARRTRVTLGVALLALFLAIAVLRPVVGPYLRFGGDGGKVAHVIDGDTIVMADGVHVRYLGIDTPEMDAFSPFEQRLAREARDLNAEYVEGQRVVLTYDRTKKDRYGRTLAYVWAGPGPEGARQRGAAQRGAGAGEVLRRAHLARGGVHSRRGGGEAREEGHLVYRVGLRERRAGFGPILAP